MSFSCQVMSNSVTPWTAAQRASLSLTICWSLPKFMSIGSVMLSNHLILCHPLLLCLQPFPGCFPVSQLFTPGGQVVFAPLSPPYLLEGIMEKYHQICIFQYLYSSVSKESVSSARDLGLIPGTGIPPGEGIGYPLQYSWASLVAQLVKNPLAMRETWVRSLGREDPLKKGKATHTSIPA